MRPSTSRCATRALYRHIPTFMSRPRRPGGRQRLGPFCYARSGDIRALSSTAALSCTQNGGFCPHAAPGRLRGISGAALAPLIAPAGRGHERAAPKPPWSVRGAHGDAGPPAHTPGRRRLGKSTQELESPPCAAWASRTRSTRFPTAAMSSWRRCSPAAMSARNSLRV